MATTPSILDIQNSLTPDDLKKPLDEWSNMSPKVKKRVLEIAEKISNGESTQSLKEFIIKSYKVTPLQAKKYIALASKYLSPTDEDLKTYLLSKSVSNLETIVEKSINLLDKNGNPSTEGMKTAIAAIKELNSIAGLTRSTNVMVTDEKNGTTFTISFNNEH